MFFYILYVNIGEILKNNYWLQWMLTCTWLIQGGADHLWAMYSYSTEFDRSPKPNANPIRIYFVHIKMGCGQVPPYFIILKNH